VLGRRTRSTRTVAHGITPSIAAKQRSRRVTLPFADQAEPNVVCSTGSLRSQPILPQRRSFVQSFARSTKEEACCLQQDRQRSPSYSASATNSPSGSASRVSLQLLAERCRFARCGRRAGDRGRRVESRPVGSGAPLGLLPLVELCAPQCGLAPVRLGECESGEGDGGLGNRDRATDGRSSYNPSRLHGVVATGDRESRESGRGE
jgi:hypothetical protein